MQTNPTSGVIKEAWELYKQQYSHLIPVAAVVYVGIAILSAILVGLLGWFGALVAAALSIIGVFWVQGALTRAVQDIRDGRADLSVGETFKSVQDKIGPIAGAAILAGLGIAIGLLLLIVPAIVLENVGALDSFGRSRAIVRGNEWNVFGVVVLTFLILVGFSLVLALILSPLNAAVQNFLSNVISGTLTAPFLALTWTLLSYRLVGDRTAEPPPPSV